VCRHSREKSLDRLLRIFAREIAPQDAYATLTLVGDGPDHDALRELSQKLGLERRVFFEGEKKLSEVQAYYQHADIFTYTSLSETYGQVVSEALWCGLPVVAMNDGKGVQQQVTHERDGFLISPGPNESESNYRFGRTIIELLANPERRASMAEEAARLARPRCAPDQNIQRFYDAFHQAKEHLEASRKGGVGAPSPSVVPSAYHLARWTSIHVALAGLGAFRKAESVPTGELSLASWSKDGLQSLPSLGAKVRKLS
jgi:1,2-diacylglycerol 3-alpha-glucosyltransferase